MTANLLVHRTRIQARAATNTRKRLASDRVGQHTRELLREAGYAQNEVDDLIRKGVCSEG